MDMVQETQPTLSPDAVIVLTMTALNPLMGTVLSSPEGTTGIRGGGAKQQQQQQNNNTKNKQTQTKKKPVLNASGLT